MNNDFYLTDLYIAIEKRWHILCDEPVLELPILNIEPKLVWKSDAVSNYVLSSVQFMNSLDNTNDAEICIDLTLKQIDQINKCWDICVSKNLDYMNLKFK